MLLLMEAPWATAPLTLVLGDLMFGSRPSLSEVCEDPGGLVAGADLHAAYLAGLLLATVVGYAIVIWRFAFLDEVILLERRTRLLWMGRRQGPTRVPEKLLTRLGTSAMASRASCSYDGWRRSSWA